MSKNKTYTPVPPQVETTPLPLPEEGVSAVEEMVDGADTSDDDPGDSDTGHDDTGDGESLYVAMITLVVDRDVVIAPGHPYPATDVAETADLLARGFIKVVRERANERT